MKRFNPAFVVAIALVGTMTLTMMRPSLAVQAFNTIVNCATATACVVGNNTGTGPGVQGISKSNAGVLGQSTSGSGVRGTSSSTSGVVGTTTTGAQAMLGQAVNTIGVKGATTSASGGGIGVQGLNAAFGTGVFGQSTNGIGVEGVGSHSVGVFGSGNTGVEALDIGGASPAANRTVLFADGFGGKLFRANNSHGVDNLTIADISGAGPGGITSAYAIIAGSAAVGTGVNANGGFAGVQGSPASPNARGVQGNNTASAGSVAIYANSFGGNEFVGNGSNGHDNFIVDNFGNVHAHSFTADLAASTNTASGAVISTYSHETRSPTIEDFGEATLAVGHAYVRLDPSFASALARGIPYYVFVTPLGPTRGMLYVSQRTSSGFYVHESGVGGSTVAFDYRIVGKRYMPVVPAVHITMNAPKIPPVIPTFQAVPKQRPIIPH